MRSDVKVVVIGGGIMGMSAAVHLLRSGAAVTVLERDGVGEGTSSAGAGFVDPWAAGAPHGDGGAEEIALAEYGIEFYRSLNAQRDDSPFRQRGLIWMASEEEDWEYVEPRLTEGPPDARSMEPDEIEEMTHGFVRAAGVFRGVLRPRSSQISAERATKALGRVFVAEGGELRERTPVTDVLVEGGRVRGVCTPGGIVEADVFVVAGGAWVNAILAPIGRFLPLVPLVVSRIITEPLAVPADLPLLFLRSRASGLPRSYWLREEHGRLMFGTVSQTAARYSFVDEPVPDRLDHLDLDGVIEVQRGAVALADAIPAIARYRNMRLKHGAPMFSPDGRALVGALAGIENLHVVAGCNEQGVTNGPGFGRVVADTILHGSTSFVDASVWNPGRFGHSLASPRDVVDAIGEPVPARAL